MRNKVAIILFLFFQNLIFGQNELPVSEVKSIIAYLSNTNKYTFSYPAELENQQFKSTLIKKEMDVEEVKQLFEKIDIECKIFNSHILLRPKNQKPSTNVKEIIQINILDAKTREKIS